MINNKKYDLFTIIIVVITLSTLAIFALVFTNLISTGIGNELRETANDMDINQTLNNVELINESKAVGFFDKLKNFNVQFNW